MIADEPPLRLILGSDALGNIDARNERVRAEMEAWRDAGAATAFDEG